MICNVDKTWTLESKDIQSLNVWVAKLIKERAEDQKINKFDSKKFVKYIYDEINNATKDEQKALAFAREVPSALLLAGITFPDIRKAIKAKGYDTSVVEELQERFSNSLQDVANFLVEISPNNAQSQASALNTAATAQPGTAPDPSVLDLPSFAPDLPDTALSTTGREIEERKFYYDFLKNLRNLYIKVNGRNSNGTIAYVGIKGGIRVSATLGSNIPIDQIYEDQKGPNAADQMRDTMFTVITDSKGKFVYFDENFRATTPDKGKLVYFPMRTIPRFTVENGVRVFNLGQVEGSSIRPIAEISDTEEGREVAKMRLQNQYDTLQNMYEYLLGNTAEILPLSIESIDGGTVDYTPEVRTPLNSINNLGDLRIATSGDALSAFKYVRIPGIESKIRFIMGDYSTEIATSVANLLFSDVYLPNGKKITTNQRINLIKQFTRLGKDGLLIDTKRKKVFINDEEIDTTNKELAKQKVIDYLTRKVIIQTKKGEDIEINNQFYFNEDLHKTGGTINIFILNQKPDGSFDFLNNNVDYNQWLKANSFISIKTDDSGNVSEKNGYLRFELIPSTADKIKKKATGFAAEREKAGIKVSKTVTPISVSTPTKGNVSEEMKKLIQNKFKNKLFSMRHNSYAATQKQIKNAEKWFNETVITYKDEKGNVVKAKLSDVVPLKVLFNFANASGDIRAQWTKAGITLFNGSDYTDLYHESWHAFTQLFMSPEERQKLYNEVKALGREIRYYDHSAGSWKKMNTADLDFSNPKHILYAEEFLADEYRNYAMNKGTVAGAIKTFFKKMLDMLKALFKGTSIQNSYDAPILREAFDNLHVGNLVNYTFNQQNIQFDVLNSGITALTPEEGKVNTVDISTALEFSESLYGYLSEFVDTLNTGDILGADAQTSIFTYKLLSDPDVKKMALQYAKERFEQDIVYFQNLLDNAESEFEKLRYERLISDLSFAYDNFGDFESGNFQDGVIGFFNKRTGFFDISLENAEEDPEEATDVVDADGNKQEGKDKDGSSPFNKNNDKSTYQRVDPVMKFIFGSLYDREDATADNPEGLVANRLFGKRLLDPASAFTVISSVVGNAPTKDKMFEALFFESEKTNTFGMPTRKALIIRQFLDKIGTPTTQTLESVLLWNKTFHNLRYDRLEGVQVLIKTSPEGIKAVNVGTSMGFVKSLEKSIKDRWLVKNPSPFARKNENGEYYLDLKALAKKYTSNTIRRVQEDPDRLFDFFNDFGIPLTSSIEAAKKIVDYGILNDLWSYNLKAWLSDEYNKSEVKSLDQLLFSKFKEVGAPQSQEGVFKRLLNIEAEHNIDALSEMIYDSMQNLRSEKFSPSSASNIINDLNASQSYQEVIQNNPQGILDVYNISKNPRVKTSQLFQKLFGKNLQERQTGAKRAEPIMLKLDTVLGTQLVELDGTLEKFVAGLNSADSDLTTSYIRDFFLYSYTGYAEAYKHADKNLAFLLSVTGGDPGDARYVDPKLFVRGIQTGNSDGRQKANAIILDYIGSELEFIRKTQADYVTGENPQDIIIGKSNLKELGNSFKTFDDILTNDIKAELIANDAIQTVEDFRAYLSNNFDFKNTLIQELNNYFDKVIAKDKEILERSGLANNKAVLASLGQSRAFSSSNLNDVFDASVEHFSYISFIHKHEMATLIYGDPVYFDHDKDEHMKRVPLFFATGKVALSDSTTEGYLAKNPGTYANSEWFKKSGLKAPTRSHYTGHIINTSVLEDPTIDSPYFDYYVDIAVSKGMSREAAEQKYAAYKGMKIGDGFAWMSFDAYRALEIKYDNWNPAKQDLYNKIISNEELTDKDQENISAFFPVKKLQYSGWLKTTNLPVPGTHKFAVGPLIPNVIAGSRLESLHNKMVSQEISYVVLQSGSKTASIGKDGQLSKFYTEKNGQNPAFTDPNYIFHKNVIYSPFLKEQVKSDDKFKGKIGMPSQLRKIAISGIYEFGYPVDFKPNLSDAERRKAWQKLSNDKKKEESPLYRLEQTYLESVDKMIKVAEAQLKMELGYKDPNAKSKDTSYNLSKLADFFKKQLTAQDISEYDLNFIKIGSTGEFEIPLDLISDPVRLEKLVVSVANKRVYKHMVNGDSFVQTPVLGFEKFSKPTDADIITYGNRDLRFYSVDPVTGRTLPMQVKISLHGQYFKLLDLNHNDGKKIETLKRLNDMLKNEEWLATNDNRKMITMVAARIPTQAENFIEVMEIAEFLPAAAGPIMLLPEEIVAKNGSDFDIDKLYVLKPVIKNNRGNVEYIKAKKTKKKYETIVKDKAILKQKINDVYAEYDEYIEEVKKQKFELTAEQQEELDLINSSYKEVGKLRKEINRAYDNLINNTDLLGPDLEAYQNLEDNLQSKIDSISQEKRNFFKRLFGEFIDDTMRRRNAEIEEFNVELRELEREAFSYKSLGYQNDMMEAMTGILLSPEYFEKLTAGTDTSFFTNKGGVVDKFTGVNREFRKTENYTNPNTGKMSPTRPMENYYNNSKAEAIAVGGGGIGMVATDITFSALAKESDLSMSYEYTVNTKQGSATIKQFLLVPHNTVKDADGRDVISFAGGKDAGELERQVSEVLSQIANGYLEIAKNDFLYDVNITKELETEAAMLLQQGVPLETVVGLLSQPLVREYLRLAKSYNSPIKVATGEIANKNFAKSQALVDVLKNFAPTYLNLVEDKDTGEIKYLNPGYDKIASKISQDLFGTDPINISELEERSKTKLDELTDEDLRIFLHTVQIMVMARQYKDLKYATNFDTVTSSSVIDVINRRKKILALSGAFPREALERLIGNTILKSFSNQQIIVDAARSILPVRNNDAVLKFISENYSSQELGDTDVRERMIRDFSNNLPHYIFFNYQPGINDLGTSYKSYTTNKELVVKPQALLRFGAFVDPSTQELLIDENFIREQYNKNMFSDPNMAYGEGILAKMPSDMFSGYKENGYAMYRNFVIEREIARSMYPYETISDNGEFRLFRLMRNKDISLPDLYEEFIRNKGLENALIDKALFKSVNVYSKYGIFSYADTYRFILSQFDITQNYPVLDQLYPAYDPATSSRYVSTKTFIKDGMLETAYKSQMKRLADPAERKVESEIMNDAISTFFAKMPMIGFVQAGNNAMADYYIGSVVDTIAVAEYMRPAVDKFLQDMEGPSASAILSDYKSKLNAKGMLGYYNFSSSTTFETTPVIDEFAIADSLPPIEQNFKDGSGGRKMQPQFANKSTMDLIISGDRTRTTRAKTDIARMMKDYNLSKIEDLVGKVIRMSDNTGRQVYTRITKVSPFTQEYQDATWQKEGWEKSVTDKHVGNYPYAIEFEVIQAPTQAPVSKNSKEIVEELFTKLGGKKVSKGLLEVDGQHWYIDNNYWKIEFKNGRDELFLYPDDDTEIYIGERSTGTKNFTTTENIDTRSFTEKLSAQSITEIKTISEPYGVVVAETNPSQSKTQEFVRLIQPQIKAQAYKENASGTANDMFMYGLRWTRKSTAKKPLNNKSYANKGLPITDAKATDGYVYDTVDQNGNPLAPISDLQPIIEEIQNALGIDMSNYDAVIGNIYLPGQNIATHRDTTESLSARNYPVVVYTIGNNSGISIYENEKSPGSASFASDKKTLIPTKDGTIYTFGMGGKGRFELAHDTPKGVKRDQKFPPITLPDGRVVENYTITLTFRRAADLAPRMPISPTKPVTPPKTVAVTSSIQISDPQKVFQDFVVAQSGPQMKVDYDTGEVVEFAKIYKESSIIQDGKYGLTINNINTLFNENPDTVFVYDDVYVKEEDRNSLLPQSNNRLAWRMGLKTGNSFAISTKLASGAAPTDEQYEKMKSIIDAQIEALKALRDSGKKIVFSSYGVAQNWAGFEFLAGKMIKKDTVPAPTAFVYLSKRLFDEFGYRNPRFDAVTTQTELKEDITTGLTGVEYYQENYKNQGIQSITDKEIVEFIKMCKGL